MRSKLSFQRLYINRLNRIHKSSNPPRPIIVYTPTLQDVYPSYEANGGYYQPFYPNYPVALPRNPGPSGPDSPRLIASSQNHALYPRYDSNGGYYPPFQPSNPIALPQPLGRPSEYPNPFGVIQRPTQPPFYPMRPTITFGSGGHSATDSSFEFHFRWLRVMPHQPSTSRTIVSSKSRQLPVQAATVTNVPQPLLLIHWLVVQRIVMTATMHSHFSHKRLYYLKTWVKPLAAGQECHRSSITPRLRKLTRPKVLLSTTGSGKDGMPRRGMKIRLDSSSRDHANDSFAMIE